MRKKESKRKKERERENPVQLKHSKSRWLGYLRSLRRLCTRLCSRSGAAKLWQRANSFSSRCIFPLHYVHQRCLASSCRAAGRRSRNPDDATRSPAISYDDAIRTRLVICGERLVVIAFVVSTFSAAFFTPRDWQKRSLCSRCGASIIIYIIYIIVIPSRREEGRREREGKWWRIRKILLTVLRNALIPATLKRIFNCRSWIRDR